METSGNRDSGSSNEVQSWTSFLNREMAEAKEGDPVKYRLLKIIRDTLLSTNEFRAAEGAKLIDSYHRYEYFAADLSLKYLEDTGTSPFLCRLYSLLTDVSSVIPYTDPNQGGLVQLLVELRKLPQTSCMIVNYTDSFTAHAKEPVLATVLEIARQSTRPRVADGGTDESLQDDCDRWINLCSFIARCIRAGLLDQSNGGCGYALYEIDKGLQQNHHVQIMRKCFTTVAVNYILIAGTTIYNKVVISFFKRSKAEEVHEKWLHWQQRVKEIGDSEDAESELGRTAREAHDLMISLRGFVARGF